MLKEEEEVQYSHLCNSRFAVEMKPGAPPQMSER
jgi:hypothetical protein